MLLKKKQHNTHANTTFLGGVERWRWCLSKTFVVSRLAAVTAVPAGAGTVVTAGWGALYAIPPLSVLEEAHHRVAWHLQDPKDRTNL